MPTALTIGPLDANTRAEAERRYNTTTDADTRLRYHIILLAAQGYTAPRIAPLILRSDDMVQEVLKRFRAGGLDAVPRRYAPGRARTVTPAWEAALLRVIERDPHEVGVQSATWTTGLLATYLARVHATTAGRRFDVTHDHTGFVGLLLALHSGVAPVVVHTMHGELSEPMCTFYEEVAERIAAWHASLAKETVVAAHGGTGRGLIAVLVIAGFVFFIVMLYVSSVMRFILFDSVLAKECHYRHGEPRRERPCGTYLLWQFGLMLDTVAGVIGLVVFPATVAFGMGWFNSPREHVLALVLSGIGVFFVMLLFFATVAVVHVFTKDFVVPQMALEVVSAVEGWRRLWPLMPSEQSGYAAYVGIKFVLAIGAAIVIGIASLIILLVVAIPTAGVGIIAVLAGKTAGLTWNVFTITAAVVVGCIVLAAFFYLVSLIAVPAIVFFPAYAIYFFAARYRPLSLVLYPLPPSPTALGPAHEPAG